MAVSACSYGRCMGTEISIDIGCRHDVPDLLKLARTQLPTMSYLHERDMWDQTYRFGSGRHPLDSYFLVARATQNNDDSGPLVGFIWVDPAMHTDHGITEPWWCINAVAVEAAIQGIGLGRQLVSMVQERADDVGISSIYGLSHSSGFGFWESQNGFVLAPPEVGLVSSSPVTVDGSDRVVRLDPEPGHRFFYASRPGHRPDEVVLEGAAPKEG